MIGMVMDGMNKRLYIFAAALLALFACTKEMEVLVEEPGEYDPIVHFGFETEYNVSSSPETKTSYSGETIVVGSERYERIDWKYWDSGLPDGDVVRVMSKKAVTKKTTLNPSGKSAVDYKVVKNSRTNRPGYKDSEAEAVPYSGDDDDNLYWEPSQEDHYFFAVYPSPAYPSSSCDLTVEADGKTARIIANIPEAQSYVGKGGGAPPSGITGPLGKKLYEYAPVMDRAFMYASARVAGKDVGVKKVPLRFKPLFTAIQLNFTAGDHGLDPVNYPGNIGAENFKIKKVRIYSDATLDKVGDPRKSTNMSGNYEVRLSTPSSLTSGFTLIDSTITKRSVYMEIPESERVLLGKDTVRVTLLAMPVDQKYLSVEITFEDWNGVDPLDPDPAKRKPQERVRLLHLQYDKNKFADSSMDKFGTNDKTWYELPGTRKLYIRAGLPDIEYIFQVKQKTERFPKEATSIDEFYTVISYRKVWDRTANGGVGGEKLEPWPWKAVSYHYDKKWHPGVDSKPGWVSQFTKEGWGDITKGGDGNVIGEKFTAGVIDNNFTASWNSLDNDTPEKAFNLGNHDIYGKLYPGWSADSETPYETANCYVVSAPGWYKFPVVYGNSYKNGQVNTAAYKNEATSGDYIMKGAFLRYRKSDAYRVRGPWLTKAVTQNGDNIGFNSAHILWEDVDGMVTVPEHHVGNGTLAGVSGFTRHYIYFYVDPSKMSNGGNAVVCLCNGGFSEIVWSWHIWVIPRNRLDPSITQEVYYYREPSRRDFSGGQYDLEVYSVLPGTNELGVNDMMDINLGYVEGLPPRTCLVRLQQRTSGKTGQVHIIQEGDPSTASAIHYQWGRKDPMWSVGNNPDNKEIYYYHQDGSYKTKVVALSANQPVATDIAYDRYIDLEGNAEENGGTGKKRGVDYSIRHPDMLIASEEYGGNAFYMWSRKRYDNLWDNSITSYVYDEDIHVDKHVVKTIYDPCPPGFKVPNEYAFTAFNKIAMDEQVHLDLALNEPRADSHNVPTDVINGLESSFAIGSRGAAGTIESEGMWLYTHPRDTTLGVIYFPALGRRRGFGSQAGKIHNYFKEGLYWTAAPFQTSSGLAYVRSFVLRRNSSDKDPADVWDSFFSPQCIPVYTRAASPYGDHNTGFMRSHAFQIRPIADKDPESFIFVIDPGLVEGENIQDFIYL